MKGSKKTLLWCLILAASASTIRVYCQPDSNGFISIDCGLAANSSYVDTDTKLNFVSDDQFIDSGVNYKIASKYAQDGLIRYFLTVRSFPNGTRNCYTLRSLKAGSKYLVRGAFMYGNYDNLNNPPTFDIHLGVNYWTTIKITTAEDAFFTEIITIAKSDYLEVCFINKGLGTPFITALELRPLMTSIYQLANSTQSLVFFDRLNFGGSDQRLKEIRYPDDQYDRIWRSFTMEKWTKISTDSTVDPDTDFATPSLVMQTAATTLSTNQSLDIAWSSDNTSTVFLVILHIGEIQDIPSTDLREFDIFANGEPAYMSTVPDKLYSGWASYEHTTHTYYNISLKATSRSTLPPLINALELYVVTPATTVPTDTGDVSTMNAIKTNYKANKIWSGDPCVPTELSWTGVRCSSDSSNIPRIMALNLTSTGLTGAIVSFFGNLSSLQSLDLSYNDLSGVLPTALDQLTALNFLDITGNSNVSTTLPPGLKKKYQDGNLTFRFGNATLPPSTTDSKQPIKHKKSLAVPIAIIVVVLLLLTAVVATVLCMKKHTCKLGNKPSGAEGPLNFENREFNYRDLKKITNNFKDKIGKGGFGIVYFGVLENKKVAVKLCIPSPSPQGEEIGNAQFLAEAKILTRVHHKNLVNLIGYCNDTEHMALVYEYMDEGALKNKLEDNTRPLTWKQRLHIAYGSALGLEYLHKACDPPLIHRDVKTDNILLDANLDAKIADFGLSKSFKTATKSHVSTQHVAGTPGYLDPEYCNSGQPTKKSDVYSFGVVLLEIITGKPPIIENPGGNPVALIYWVNRKLSTEDIRSIVDPRMEGQYDINSIWKVTDLACKCTAQSSAQRPTMSVIVAEVEESLHLENSTGRAQSRSTTHTNLNNYSRNNNFVSDVRQNSVFEMTYMGGMPGPHAA